MSNFFWNGFLCLVHTDMILEKQMTIYKRPQRGPLDGMWRNGFIERAKEHKKNERRDAMWSSLPPYG